ncbi:hypothetical protein MAFF212519_12530 [Clavibacter michiganensis]
MTQDPTTPPSSDLSRRGFLITSGAAGALGVAGLGGALPAVAATASDDALDASAVKAPAAQQGSGARWKPDTASPRFTIAVLPDTQYLFDGKSIHPEPLEASLRYVLAERDRHNIVFLAHLGDVTQNGAANEIQAASAQFTLLDKAGAAWSVLAGNHDVDGSTDDQRGRTPYLDAFGPKRFRKSPSYRGSSPDGYNSFHTFTAGGRDWLVLALDWRTSARGVEWARGVLAAHPTLPVILTAHDIVDSKPDGSAVLDDYGQGLWDSFISQHDQIFLTLNGHYWKPGRTTMTNRAGHDVAMHLVNYQDRYYGGAAMIRLYHVDLERNAIDVETLSPFILGGGLGTGNELADGEAALSGDVDRFTVSVDFEQRFAGFAPVPARAARPAAQMLVPGTVAYWRFDGQADGSALGTTTRIRDASGRGNDLVVANRAGAAPGSLRFASAHHDDQPGFGSLALTGGKKSGDYLRTVDGPRSTPRPSARATRSRRSSASPPTSTATPTASARSSPAPPPRRTRARRRATRATPTSPPRPSACPAAARSSGACTRRRSRDPSPTGRTSCRPPSGGTWRSSTTASTRRCTSTAARWCGTRRRRTAGSRRRRPPPRGCSARTSTPGSSTTCCRRPSATSASWSARSSRRSS